jgi:3-dehydroquinate synthase
MTIRHAQGTYDVRFDEFNGTTHVVVTDSNLAKLYPKLIGSSPIVIEAGESSKNLDTYAYVAGQLLHRGATRKSTIVALGGGVVGDLVGFVAATYMRGIPFVQVPTTLLAQVDSSVGGKVGVDLPEGKNLLGAFHPAKEVIIDSRFLKTLPERELRCGLAEIVKYGWIMAPEILDELSKSDLDLQKLVRKCVELKARVVQEDEFETKGVRAWLNFGHTVGHAIEQITNYETYTHGEAISIGMVVETRVAEEMGLAGRGLSQKVQNSLAQHGLPTELSTKLSVSTLIDVMRRDKKSDQREITMSLVYRSGQCELVKNVPVEIIERVLA